MKTTIVFDATVLVNAAISGNIYKTGIYRVSIEILNGLIEKELFNIFLFDIYLRERELSKLEHANAENCKVLPVYPLYYKALAYPIMNLADKIEIIEKLHSKNKLSRLLHFAKVLLKALDKLLRLILTRDKLYSSIISFTENDFYLSTFNKFPDKAYLKNLKRAIIIHDLIPIYHPEFFFDERNSVILKDIIQSIQPKDIVFCVSNSTRDDLLKYNSSFHEENIMVMPLAGAQVFKPNKSDCSIQSIINKKGFNDNTQYFLSVCTIEPRKNLITLIDAFERLLKKHPELGIPRLVLTGEIGWKVSPLLERIDNINKRYGEVIFLTGFVADTDLAILYSNCRAFIYPSLFEGFGLPPLEAMQCGSPVIVSNSSSLPEVVGTQGLLFNPLDASTLTQKMESFFSDDVLKVERKKSLDRARLFSWEKTIEIILLKMNTSQ